MRTSEDLHIGWRALAFSLLGCGAIALVIGTVGARAATVRVSQDGTGDFSSVFDATTSAADGDTISIGSGTYDDLREVTLDGNTFKAIGLITASNVHVVGDSRDQVRLGPAVAPEPIQDELEYGLIAWFQASGVSVATLTVQNLARGIADSESAISVRDCSVTNTYSGIRFVGIGDAKVENCVIDSAQLGIIAYLRPGSVRTVRIQDSSVADCGDAIQLQGINGWITGCTVSGSNGGVTVLGGSSVVVSGTQFENNSVLGAEVGAGSVLQLEHCKFVGPGAISVRVNGGGALLGQNNQLQTGDLSTLWLSDPSQLEFSNNHILNVGGLSVRAGSNPQDPKSVSLAGNWWGTTDLAQVEDWITHAPDEPSINGLTVTFEPIANSPVESRSTSVGKLKSHYRP